MTITAARVEEVFAVLKHAARNSKPCPTNGFIADQIKMSESAVRTAVRILADQKRIVVERASNDRRMRVGGYHTTWSTPRHSGGYVRRQPVHTVRFDTRDYEMALRATGGRFTDAPEARRERTGPMPSTPEDRYSHIGCAAAMTEGA